MRAHQKVGVIVAAALAVLTAGVTAKVVWYPAPPVPPTTTTTTSPSASCGTYCPESSYIGTGMAISSCSGNGETTSSCDVMNLVATSWPTASGSMASQLDGLISSDGTWLNTNPLYFVPSSQGSGTNQYTNVTFSVAGGCNNFLGSSLGEVSNSVPVPNYTALNGSSDNPLVLYNPTTGNDYEFWQASQNSTTAWSACWGGEMSTADWSGVFPFPYGLSATGVSEAQITLSENDVYQATCVSGNTDCLNTTSTPTYLADHALGVELPSCSNSTSYYPAVRGDSSCTNSAEPRLGSYFRLSSSATCSTTGSGPCSNVFARIVFNTLQTYGMVATDYAGGVVAWEMEQTSDWAAQGNSGTDPITSALNGAQLYSVLSGLPWSNLQQIVPPGCSGSSMTWMGTTAACPS